MTMRDAEGFVLWITSAPVAGGEGFALEVRARLAQGRHRAKLLTASEACAFANRREIDDETIENISGFCHAQQAAGCIPIISDDVFSRAVREEIQRKLPLAVNVLVKSSTNVQSAVIDVTGKDIVVAPQFEEPSIPDLIFQTGVEPLTRGINRLLALLESRELIEPSDPDLQRDEQLLTERLKDLGYL